jgi:hypothetical protein
LRIVSETYETQLPNRARTRIGVGEAVKLTVDKGPAQWTVAKGMGDVYPEQGTTVKFTAQDQPGKVTVVAKAKGCEASIIFEVVEPSGLIMKRMPGTGKRHFKNTPSTGMITEIWLQPPDVSFKAVHIHEQEAYAVGTDAFKKYCEENQVGHNPNPNDFYIDTVDANGSKCRGYDRVAAQGSAAKGTMTWSIPWEYTVNNSFVSKRIAKSVEQVATFGANGTVRVTKATAEVSSKLGDPQDIDSRF